MYMDNVEANAVFIGDERRQQIYSSLLQYNTVLAGVYRSAIRNFKTPAYPGEERARISNISNAMREIMNSLASVLGDSSQGTRQDDAGKLTRKLPEKLAEHPELDLQQDNAYIPVPQDVALLVREIANLASQEQKSAREDVAALIAPGSGETHPVVKEWIDTRNTFVGHTHLGRPPKDVSVSDKKIEELIRTVEDIMESRLREFFESRHEVDSLLADINDSGED